MPKVIAVANQKGGCGKSTLVICSAVELAMRDHSVVMIDLDPQGTTGWWGENQSEAEHSPITVLSMGAADLKAELAKVNADFILVDVPGTLGDEVRDAMIHADLVLIPTLPSPPDLWALPATLDLFKSAAALVPHLQARVVLNRVNRITRVSAETGETVKELAHEYGAGAWTKTVLSQRTAYESAVGQGKGITTYQPESPGAAEMRDLVTKLTTWGQK